MTSKSIGRYQVLSEIGRGGMAVVYLCQDPTFIRQVAIKVLPTQFLENELLRARFEREARTIATLEHPAIVPVHDFGEQDGQLYLVMRYMPGGSLADRIRKGALPPGEAIHIIAQLAPALDAVHTRGIVHRDLKPGNILFDAFGNAALSDFGIAQLTEATMDLTGDAIIGTPSYMSPEQVRSDAEIDGRSDLYALGIILYEMLTGRQPYRAATPLSVAMKHLTEPVPRLQAYHPDFPPELDTILAKTLAKDRDQRYARASELSTQLQTVKDLPKQAPDATVVDVQEPAEQDAPADEAGAQAPLPADVDASQSEPDLEILAERTPTGFAPPTGELTTAPLAAKPAISRRAWLLSLSAGGVFTLAGLCLLLILGFLAYRANWFASLLPQAPSETSAPVAPATPTQTQVIQEERPEPTATIPTPGTLLFSDDFSVHGYGWPRGASDGAQYDYEGGTYRVMVEEPDILYWVSPTGIYNNISLSVLASLVSGKGESYFGLLCRIQDENNLYYLVVRADSYFTIGKLKDGKFSTLLSGGWTYSEALAAAEKPYSLRADCSGETLRLFIGTTLLGQAQDRDFPGGRLGLGLAAIGAGERLEVIFDDFLVRELK